MVNQNQFDMSVVQGMMSLLQAHNVISAQIGSAEAGSLVAGQSVKIVDTAGKIPQVIACASDSDETFGFIVYDVKSRVFVAGDRCEISTGFNDVMYMTAGAAIAVSAKLMPVIASKKVITATSGKPIACLALDKAAADGDLIRVTVTCPAKFLA